MNPISHVKIVKPAPRPDWYDGLTNEQIARLSDLSDRYLAGHLDRDAWRVAVATVIDKA